MKNKKELTVEDISLKLKQLQKAVSHMPGQDMATKYQVASLFHHLHKFVSYQAPMAPIDVSEDGHKFTCPRCGTKFDSEDHVDDFNGCYICLQRWKKVEVPADDESNDDI